MCVVASDGGDKARAEEQDLNGLALNESIEEVELAAKVVETRAHVSRRMA